MMRNLSRCCAAFLAQLSLLALLCLPALAAVPAACSIRFSVETQGEADAAAQYRFTLTPVTPNAPMPEAEPDIAAAVCEGAGTASFAPIGFSKPGSFVYQLAQQAGEAAQCRYDETVFYVRVRAVRGADGLLRCSQCVYRDAQLQQEKCEPVFVNVYPAAPVRLQVCKRWSDDGKNRPDHVTVQLLDGQTAVQTVTLSAENDWRYTWPALRGEGSWQVREIDIPAGYRASYRQEGDTVIIQNTRSLLQTGQARLPILMLGGGGLILLLAGMPLSRRARRRADG